MDSSLSLQLGRVAVASLRRSYMLNVTSKDGTQIAYHKAGEGPPLLIMGGSLAALLNEAW
jgi:hypothetical protein